MVAYPVSSANPHDPEVLIVGSGPSGVAVARPLLEAGLSVLMIDGGRELDERLVPREAYHDLRRHDPDQWRLLLGDSLDALRPSGPPSPKFAAPASRFAFDGFNEAHAIEQRKMVVVGSLARGGLSNIWGAGLGTYDEHDLADFPLAPTDLAGSYRRVAARMGVIGFGADDLATEIDESIDSQTPLKPAENARRLLDRYERKKRSVNDLGVRLGRPRVALLTEPRDDREACRLCDACLWGCRYGSIWNAQHELRALRTFANLDYRPGLVVTKIEPAGDGYRLWAQRADDAATPSVSLGARRVVLAAGTPATTRLVLQMQNRFDETLPVHTSPTAGFALFLPDRLGAALPTREFSMAQISLIAAGEHDPGDRAYGNLFTASGVPGSLMVERMPLTRPAAVHLFRYLQPALLLGNCFLSSRHARTAVKLERDGQATGKLVFHGVHATGSAERFSRLRVQLTRAFRKLGAWMVPSSFTVTEPGSDVRHAGTFPMRSTPGFGEVGLDGELHGSPGLHLVDLSIFPAMGSKHPTFTLMANAERIGRALARH